MQFGKFDAKAKHPFCVYVDFETVRSDTGSKKCKTCAKLFESCACKASSTIIGELRAMCFSMIIVKHTGEIMYQCTYTGDDAAHVLICRLMEKERNLLDYIHQKVEICMSEIDEEAFATATECWLCNEEIIGTPVRDHCHMTGDYLGAAHQGCNLQRRESRIRIPVYAHNMRGFDSAFIVQAMSEDEVGETVSCIGGEYLIHETNNNDTSQLKQCTHSNIFSQLRTIQSHLLSEVPACGYKRILHDKAR